MNWLQCILYGFVLGISEFIPVPTRGQGAVMQMLFGTADNDAVRDLIIHICSLIAFLIAWRIPLSRLRNSVRYAPTRPAGRTRPIRENADSRFVRASTIPMLLVMILSFYFCGTISAIPMALLLVLNGIVIYLPERMLQGNKTARSMSAMDAWIVGAASGLSVIPGFSRIGLGISAAQMRGSDRANALKWAYMLSIPAMLLLVGADIVRLIFASHALILSAGVFGYLLMAVASFAGSYLSVYFLRNAVLNRSASTFAYYSWGLALFIFILYLL